MPRLEYWTTLLACFGVSLLSGFAQNRTTDKWPPPPALGIQDESGFFDRDPEAAERISDQLRKLEADYGFRILVMVEPVLIGTSASELAAELQQSWLPDGGGLVVVCESDSRRLGIGPNIGGEPAAGVVPTHETAAILARASKATDPSMEPVAYLEALIGNLVKEFDSYFKRRDAPPPAGRSMRLTLLTVGGAALLALVAISIGALVRLPSVAGRRRFRFPPVDRPERLGAPGGGGNVTVRRFRQK